MLTDNDKIYDYILPIVKSVSGFASSAGFVLIYYDKLIIRSFDSTYLVIVNILPTNMDAMFNIKEFIANRDIFTTPLHYNKHFIVKDDMMRLLETYGGFINDDNYTIHIPNIQDIPEWNGVRSIGVSWVKEQGYKTCVSKWYTPLNAKDTCHLSVYDRFNDGSVLLKYTLYKKKVNLEAHIFLRQMTSYNTTQSSLS